MVMRPEDRNKAAYVVLRAIAGSPRLREELYLKGAFATEGYTGRPRSTEDIDFTIVEELPTPNKEGERDFERLFASVVEDHLEDHDREWSFYGVSVHKNPSSKCHPRGWDSFEVKITLQIRGRTRHTVKLEISPEDPPIDSVLFSCMTGEVAMSADPISESLKAYSRAEIVAEKLRAFLQSLPPHRAKIGGGGRLPRVRDIWDIAALVDEIGSQLRIGDVARAFERKCASRFVDCSSVDDFTPNPDSVEVFKQAYEADDELTSIPFADAWSVMTDVVRRIETEYGLPGVFLLDDAN